VGSVARKLETEGGSLQPAGRRQVGGDRLLGLDGGLRAVGAVLDRIAVSNSTVFLRGETGVGKELVARELHHRSLWAEGPFVRSNCAALEDSLLESDLFGCDVQPTESNGMAIGSVDRANGGTLFLDEIGAISPKIQMALLRLLQDGVFQRVGNGRTLQVDVRIIAATSAPLEERIALREFREDLFYWLNVVPLHVPPLRDRLEDIRPLAESFIRLFADRLGKRVTLSEAALERLLAHSWPGNVRELRNVVERACVLCDRDACIAPEQLHLESGPMTTTTRLRPLDTRSIYAEIAREDAMRLAAALREARGSKARAARLLGIPRTTLNDRLRRLDLG